MIHIGTIIRSEREHQCILCLLPVCVGESVMAAAYDMLGDGMVWCHEMCARGWHDGTDLRITFMLSNGWEVLSGSQKCQSCGKDIRPGLRAYRTVNAGLHRYDRICRLCWMRKVMA